MATYRLNWPRGRLNENIHLESRVQILQFKKGPEGHLVFSVVIVHIIFSSEGGATFLGGHKTPPTNFAKP